MNENLKQKLITFAKIAFAAGILYWLIRSGKFDFNQVYEILKDPKTTILLLILAFCNIFFASERWRVLMGSQVNKYGSIAIFKMTLMGLFFNYVMPGGVGGDIIKSVYISRNNTNQKAKAILTILLDRILGLYCMLFVAIVVMLVDIEHVLSTLTLKAVFFTMLLALIFASFVLLTLFSKRFYTLIILFFSSLPQKIQNHSFTRKIKTLIEDLAAYRNDKRSVILALALSFASQFFAYYSFYFIAQSLGYSMITLGRILIITPIGFIVNALPITPGGVGVGQYAFHHLYEIYYPGLGALGAVSISISQLITFFLGLFGCYFFIRAKKHLAF